MSTLRYRAWTKATADESGAPRYSANWVTARRAWFLVFDDRIECGDWTVPAGAVEDAVLYHSRQWFIPVSVLSIATGGQVLQFGFNPWVKIGRHLPFPYRQQQVRLKYSTFSIIVRVLLLLGIVYWVLTKRR
jgi:hypothetical protein